MRAGPEAVNGGVVLGGMTVPIITQLLIVKFLPFS